jgi:hypothetical protein
MQELRYAIPPQLNSRRVLFRVVFRLVLLTTFATFGSQGFGKTFASSPKTQASVARAA